MNLTVRYEGDKTMKKWMYIGGALILIVVAALVIGLSKLGPIIKTAVNTYGPKITKTEVRVKDVGISLFAGEAKLKDFYLGNPKGFNSPQAMSVKAIYVDVDEKSITGNPIIIDRIEVVAPEINYEKVRRTDNFKTILNNVKKSARTSKSSTSKEKSSKDGAGKKFVIKNFIVRDGNVNMAMSAQGGPSLSASASLPDIHLKNVGEKSGGATAEEVFNTVFAALYEKIASPAVTATLNKELKTLVSRVPIEDEATKKTVENTVNETVKGLFGNRK
jgi:uncharacterized protein involved in outer membrane biogenesis